jgi:hypothetical protein
MGEEIWNSSFSPLKYLSISSTLIPFKPFEKDNVWSYDSYCIVTLENLWPSLFRLLLPHLSVLLT